VKEKTYVSENVLVQESALAVVALGVLWRRLDVLHALLDGTEIQVADGAVALVAVEGHFCSIE
jgi:hypothetical protein